MAIRKILVYPHPILEAECEQVLVFDKKLRKLIHDMFETMYANDGVGLAAPQIGVSKQLVVVDVSDEGNCPVVLINPVMTKSSGEQIGMEGCLSFPEVFGDVKRANDIEVTAQNEKGKTITIKAKGFFARAIQHEIDHLHGSLFTSKVMKYYKKEELQ